MIFICICFFGLLQTVRGEGVSAIFSAEWNRNYANTTAPNIFNTYQLLAPKGSVGRIVITREEKHLNVTLLVVVRQPKGIVSFTVPENIDGFLFTTVARTLNPFMVDQNVTVEFWSVEPVEFTFTARQIQDDFAITLDRTHICNASVAQPVYYSVSIPSDIDSIFINVDSNTSMCMTVSVQPYGAPVSDLTSNVLSSGMYQTMTKQSTVAVERDHFPKFFLVFVLEPNDNDCSSWKRIVPATGHTMHSPTVTKIFEVRVAAKMKQKEYLLPMLLIAFVLLVILLITLYYMKFEMSYDSTDSERFQQFRDDMRVHEHHHTMRPEDDQSLSGSWDFLPDALDREVVRANTHLMVADLATKSYEQRNDKYMKYVFYLIIIALFYTLPSVQLVFNAVDSIRSYGNLDLCWYNFRCARPFWNFFAFNNIISNAAYVFLGALLIIMTYERNKVYKQHVAKEPAVETDYGLPQHPALTYAIGIAIILEGMLSASYHICPSATNYQFDTSFMYVIALLGKLKIYQLRHPDIIAQAHNTFGVMAGFILIAMIGVRWHSNVVWILFPIIYVLLMALVSLEFYFKGVWKINPRETWNSFRYAWASSKWCSCMFPRYWGRFIFLLLANIINVVLILLGEITRPADFASYLLIPFIANLFLYLLYYIVMKFSHGERLSFRALGLLAIASLCWAASLWFFFHQVSDWSQTPAMSRELNKNCIIVNFFDNHDVWHILSAIAMFISFILLDRIDDDLRFVERHSIPVF